MQSNLTLDTPRLNSFMIRHLDFKENSWNMDLTSYMNRLTNAIGSVKPVTTRPQSTDVFVQPDLRYSTDVFVRRDSHRRPFESS
ncbi:unnamed protein product [Schistosoma margrebowiei]|uniref:Uncharacterized protein n=1 Tax=Schistosoma margrebowiei TaxID=48269 RepID=A0A183MSQ0_9TREM|nr:unnamed protein product [Schistosoma margrebowiei]